MNVLAIDTSHPTGSVALSVDGRSKGIVRFGDGSSHLAEIGAGVDRLLAGARVGIRDVHRLALVRGPGSFTGLRIGMAFAKGLYAGLDVDMVTVSTLELLALPHLDAHKSVCPMVDARKGEIYAALFDQSNQDGAGFPLTPQVEPCAREPKQFVEHVCRFAPLYVGSGALQYRLLVEEADGAARIGDEDSAVPSAALLGEKASAMKPLSREAVAALEPYYIRPSDAIFKPLKAIDRNG